MNKTLRSLRIVMSTIFIVASVAMLLYPTRHHSIAQYAEKLQIIPSLLGMTAGIALFWVAVTLVVGRVYCSSVCPLGTLQDIFIFIRRKTKPNPDFRPARAWLRWEALLLFVVCIAIGLSFVYVIMEPWHIFRNIVSIVHPQETHIEALHYTFSATAGVIAGVISLILLAVISFLYGREFCNSFCPVGVAMRMLDTYTFYSIEIDPDRCTSCLKCQDICKSRCIDVKTRTVDNSRCVRCFDCLEVCADEAINLTSQRPRAATPLMKRTQKTHNT